MPKKSASVLIVDDNALDREFYERLLARNSEYDFDVSHCEIGEDALAICHRAPPDCILLDYLLPDIDGIEFLLSIQNDRPQGVMPAIVMITGQGASSIAVDAIRHGADDYLVKDDIDEERLNRAIPRALNSRHTGSRDHIKKHTVMVIDDCAHDRELYKRLLQETAHSRFEFVEVASGTEALASISVRRPDCILLDYNLPDFDGLELLDALRYEYKKHGLAAPVILMLTGQGNECHAVAAIKRGANDYLVKSEITREVLKQSVISTLEIRSLHEKLQVLRKENDAISDAVSYSLDALITNSLDNCDLIRQNLSAKDMVGVESLECVYGNLTLLQRFSHELAAIRQASLRADDGGRLDLLQIIRSVVTDLQVGHPALAVEFNDTALSPVYGNSMLISSLFKNAIVYVGGEDLNIDMSKGLASHRVRIKFSRAIADSTTLPVGELSDGEGLYLVLCRKVMDYHDGQIYLERDANNNNVMYCML